MPKELPISATLSEATRLFNELGVSAKGTGPRAGGDNRDPLFHEYMVAKHLESVAKKRAGTTLEAIRAGGALTDRDNDDKMSAGMHSVASSQRYQLLCEVKNTTRVDPKLILSYLARKGVSQKLLDEAEEDATKHGTSRAYRVIANG